MWKTICKAGGKGCRCNIHEQEPKHIGIKTSKWKKHTTTYLDVLNLMRFHTESILRHFRLVVKKPLISQD